MHLSDHTNTASIGIGAIENIDTSPENYHQGPHPYIKLINKHGNFIYHKSLKNKSQITLDFQNSVNCHVYIGENFQGNIDAKISSSDSLIYIGNNVRLSNLRIKIGATSHKLYIGNEVTTGPNGFWVLEGTTSTTAVIGDDCMFSSEITIRTSDGHPIFDTHTWHEKNAPTQPIVIGPHCWIGQKATILKNVSIGACSIVALGSVVTKSCPPFSSISGTPGISRSIKGKLWSRGWGPTAKEKAASFLQKYANEEDFTLPNTTNESDAQLIDD